MIALDEAQSRLLSLAPDAASRAEQVDITDAIGRFLIAPVIAQRNQPEHDLSAMDGYAVGGNGPQWRVTGEAAAGHPFSGTLASGEAVRIFTGAIVPEGATCVIMQEDMDRDGAMTSLRPGLAVVPGRHIRPKHGDFRRVDLLIPAGTRLSAAHIGLSIAAGHARLSVARKVRVAILSTGNELVRPGLPTAVGQIPASNGPMLAALLQGPGVDVEDLGIIPDELEATKAAIADASADVIITIGGASVGDHDLVRPALLELGATIDFWKVAMKPGKPLMSGTWQNSVVLGLPGNPVSAFVTALLFAKPLIEKLGGNPMPLPRARRMALAFDLPANGNRTDHLRARVQDGCAVPVGVNDSAALLALSQAEVMIIRPAGAPAISAGESVDVLDLT